MYIYRYENKYNSFINKIYYSDTFEKYPVLEKIFETLLYPVSLIYSLKIYISNRFIYKIHMLDTGLEKGIYYDLDQRILYACFNEFVKYIENEFVLDFSNSNLKHKKESTEFYIDYLKHKINNSYVNTSDKEFYETLLELYTWWKNSELEFNNHIFDRNSNEDNTMLKKLISIRTSLWS